jgi:hypothetical protein
VTTKQIDERLTTLVLRAALGVGVVPHDDNSRRPAAAAEVVSTRDRRCMSQSAAIGKRGYTRRPELARMWFALLGPGTPGRKVSVELPALLADLERVELEKIGPRWQPVWWDRLRAGNDVVRAGDAFPSDTPDVPAKLAAWGKSERHAVVLVTSDWLGALIAIEDGVVPTLAPTVPAGIDRLWLVALKTVPPIQALYRPGDGMWHASTLTFDHLVGAA